MEEMVCKHCCYFVNDDGLPYCIMKDLYTTVSPEHKCDEKNIKNEFYFTRRKDMTEEWKTVYDNLTYEVAEADREIWINGCIAGIEHKDRMNEADKLALNEAKEIIAELRDQLEKEKMLNAEIKKHLVEVEYDCEDYNHEYCEGCTGKRKQVVDLFELVSNGLNETLLKQRDEKISQLEQEIFDLRQKVVDL